VTDFPTLAAVDLGSNSFHLQMGRVVGEQIYPLDSLRESVRLGAGLKADKTIDEATQARALDCLSRFGERLRGLPRRAVRAVGTNTFRVAKNAKAFFKAAEDALGVPIDIIAGREEARLIYLGVAHSLPLTRERRLVVDIGGGSTEFIIGTGLKPIKLDSLHMGCVSYSLRYFPDGRVTRSALKSAELAARSELHTMAAGFSHHHWEEAVASSGTARSLAEVMQSLELGDGSITPEGLGELRGQVLKLGGFDSLGVPNLRPDRAAVLPGGLAIMGAIVSALKADRVVIANGAMRQGILWDLLGRVHHHDMRDVTAAQFMQRYHVDAAQAKRVAALALRCLDQIPCNDRENAALFLAWAAKLHEIGITVAYSGYQKHGAYILRNADMPGFSRMEQERLATLVLAHRRQLRKLPELTVAEEDWPLVAALRLAVLFCRSRGRVDLPEFRLRSYGRRFVLDVPESWLAANPLTETELRDEMGSWKGSGAELVVRIARDDATVAQFPTAA